MAFEKTFENDYNDLSLNTKYRFAEMELSNLITILMPIYQNKPQTVTTIFNMLDITDNIEREKESAFHDMAHSHHFVRPDKKDQIRQLILYGQTYAKIQRITKASPNHIASLRFGLPELYPIYQHWTPEILHRWETIKPAFNLYQETLVHTPKNNLK